MLLTFREGVLDPRMPELLGNVTILERPFHPRTLVSVVRSGLRARRRQREAQAFLEERERTATVVRQVPETRTVRMEAPRRPSFFLRLLMCTSRARSNGEALRR